MTDKDIFLITILEMKLNVGWTVEIQNDWREDKIPLDKI